MENWKKTDADLQQYGREIRAGVYEFKEWDRNNYVSSGKCASSEFKESVFNEPKYWIKETINLVDYNEVEIDNHISGYYGSLDEVKEIYGDDWMWIVAECIFEQESDLY